MCDAMRMRIAHAIFILASERAARIFSLGIGTGHPHGLSHGLCFKQEMVNDNDRKISIKCKSFRFFKKLG